MLWKFIAICLFVFLVLNHFGFQGRILVLIKTVPCYLNTFLNLKTSCLKVSSLKICRAGQLQVSIAHPIKSI